MQDYEETHYPVDLPDTVEAVRFRMEQKGLKQADLVSCFGGSRSRVSEFLSRRRELTKAQIRDLHRELNIPLECLFGDFIQASG